MKFSVIVVAKRRVHSTSSHKRRSDRTTLRDAKHVSNKMAMWEDKVGTFMFYYSLLGEVNFFRQ